jgi:hypothetical protein
MNHLTADVNLFKNAAGEAAFERRGELTAHLAEASFDAADGASLGAAFRALVDAGFDQLPWPGQGRTAQRWNHLAAVAGRDLSLVKLFEGHTDALAILGELDPGYRAPRAYWGVWAAEGPASRLRVRPEGDTAVLLDGTKQWCSGAAALTHALVTGWEADDVPGLYAVALDQAGVTETSSGWHAVGMQGTASAEVHFDLVPARRIGTAGAYLRRPGFWHGGAGIAACWYGAAAALARVVLQQVRERPNPHRNAHLGSILVALGEAAAVLREAAAAIDQWPQGDAAQLALRTRLSVEHAAQTILAHAGPALGAAPLCLDAHVARLMADLPVFMRQSHAEQDLAALAEAHAHLPGDAASASAIDALEQRHLWHI